MGSGVVVLSLLVVDGCASVRRQDKLIRERTGVEVSAVEFRVRVRSLARPFGGIMESASDRMLARSRTPQERVIALRLKANGIPAMHGALFEADPVGALFEATALLAQLRLFFEEGPGRELLPEELRREIESAVRDMQGRLREFGDSLGFADEDIARFWARAESWAREHPVRDTFVGRETTRGLFAEVVAASGSGFRAMAVRLDESVQDITLRFELYAEYIAKHARWQAELAVEEALIRGLPRHLVEEAGPFQVELRALPFDLPAERTLVLEALAAERALVLDWAHAERLETLDFVRAEREAVAGLVGSERRIALDAVRAERQAILAAVDLQRAAAMADLERVIARGLVASRREVVDHAVLRLGQLLAVVLPAIFLGGLALIWYARRPRPEAGP